ncbi:MAG TPA: high frequency lysogenization protein HflD [Gammaproteobacteria bacterium]|nr:high frequency lysogenization protein HflD [Gammaproteobacteria bacterium]
MKKTDRDQALALAAAFQAISLVVDIARHGRADPVLVRACLQGLVQPYHADLANLYGGTSQLRPGLLALRAQLTHARDVDFMRYAAGLLHLENRLRRQPGRLGEIAAGLERVRRQAEYFEGPASGPVIAALGHLYSEHVSTLRPRIMVTGEREYLEQPRNTDLIRALLLAALRALAFWRQHGGSRLKLLFRRTATLQAVETLLAEH